MSILKAAWVQGKSAGDLERNAAYYEDRVRAAARQGAKLIVLPELFLWDYFPIREDARQFETAIEISSDVVRRFCALAKELRVTLPLPIFEKRSAGLYHNSCLVVDATGEVAAHYRKMHIPDDPGFSEKYYFAPGDLGFVAAKTAAGTLGILICWDQWFPEAARATTIKGAQILIYPTAIAWDDHEPAAVRPEQLDAWLTVLRGHAIANGVHVMAVNRVGQEGHLKFWGNSFLADPFGRITARSGGEDDLRMVEIDFDKTTEVRRAWPFLRDRRVNQYQDITKLWNE